MEYLKECKWGYKTEAASTSRKSLQWSDTLWSKMPECASLWLYNIYQESLHSSPTLMVDIVTHYDSTCQKDRRGLRMKWPQVVTIKTLVTLEAKTSPLQHAFLPRVYCQPGWRLHTDVAICQHMCTPGSYGHVTLLLPEGCEQKVKES